MVTRQAFVPGSLVAGGAAGTYGAIAAAAGYGGYGAGGGQQPGGQQAPPTDPGIKHKETTQTN